MLGANPEWDLWAPKKFAGLHSNNKIKWYENATSSKIAELFASYEGLVCVFSLGATIRLVAPHMKDKKTDPAVVVVDEAADFAISVLSGHIGGANELTRKIASLLGAQAVITTAADVKGTIPVDMVGRNLEWVIEDDSDVTAASAHMVNEDKIGIYQDAGAADWYYGGRQLPSNVTTYDTLQDMLKSDSKAHLIISDRIHNYTSVKNVTYRPPTLTVGVGLHHDTTSHTILSKITEAFARRGLATKSIRRIASIKKIKDVPGLAEAASALGVPLVLYSKDELAKVDVPNPSRTVQRFEGTPSVSEAACVTAARADCDSCASATTAKDDCTLVVEKQKFPPDLTIAVARCRRYSGGNIRTREEE